MGLDITISTSRDTKDFRKVNFLIPWVERTLGIEVENTESYELSKSNLESLLSDVSAVLADISEAPKLLPTRTGFFFGDTEYDERYRQDLNQIKTDIGDLVLKMNDGDTATFWAWW